MRTLRHLSELETRALVGALGGLAVGILVDGAFGGGSGLLGLLLVPVAAVGMGVTMALLLAVGDDGRRDRDVDKRRTGQAGPALSSRRIAGRRSSSAAAASIATTRSDRRDRTGTQRVSPR
jgi:hypothetical protein